MPKKCNTPSKGNENNPNNFFSKRDTFPPGGKKNNIGNKTRRGGYHQIQIKNQRKDWEWFQSTGTWNG